MGVIVCGMHRSGTSLAARILNLAGVPLCDPRYLMEPREDNPKGFWENELLVQTNEEVLEALGGYWNAPLGMRPGWEEKAPLRSLLDRARRVFAETMPKDEWLFKDPRLCITLPFWCRALNGEPVVVFVTRDPLEIAGSLTARDGFSTFLSLALWERYLREGLRNLAGLPVLFVDHQVLLHEPVRWVQKARERLERAGIRFGDTDHGQIHAFVDEHLWRLRRGTIVDGDPALSDQQRELLETLKSVEEWHTGFSPPPLPKETPWAPTILEERRERTSIERRAMETKAEHESVLRECRSLDGELQDTRRRLRETQAQLTRAEDQLMELRGDFEAFRETAVAEEAELRTHLQRRSVRAAIRAADTVDRMLRRLHLRR